MNDNADPFDLRPEGFHFSELDNTVETLVLPLRAEAEVNGVDLTINLNYVAFTGQITAEGSYEHADPEEYAEFMLALFQYLDHRHGFVPDAVEILLEPDNVSQWNGTLIGRAIMATEARLRAAGYDCEFIAPSCTSMGNAVRYFDDLAAVPGAAGLLDELCYHRYGGVSDANLDALASRAQAHGLRASMLEWWSNGNGWDTFFSDLTRGMNSAWEHGVLGGPGTGLDDGMSFYRIDDTDPANPVVSLNRKARLLRQVYRFVRPGAVRIGAASSSGSLAPAAFIQANGDWVVVIKASQGGDFRVAGLPPGTYARTYATPDIYDARLPDAVLGEAEELLTTLPRDGVFTTYRKTVRLSDPELEGNRVKFVIASLMPDAALRVERSAAPADPGSWVELESIDLAGLRREWSDAWSPAAFVVYYRVVFR